MNDQREKNQLMRTVGIVYWQEEDGMWIGHLKAYPDFMTQGETPDELKENLRDILKDLESGQIPMVKIHEEMAV